MKRSFSLAGIWFYVAERVCCKYDVIHFERFTVKILKIVTPKIITVIVLQMEQVDFTVQYCLQKMQTEITNSVNPDQTAP